MIFVTHQIKRGNYMDNNEVICSCSGVTVGMLKDAITNGADTVEKVIETTGASTYCGACQESVETLVKSLLEESK